MSEEFIRKLNMSPSVKSLRFEKKVFEVFKKFGWDTIHSPYFKDTNTKKYRELDILSRAFFEKKTESTSAKLYSELLFMVECKSLSEYNLIVDAQSLSYRDDLYKIWFGYDAYYQNKKVISILNESNLDIEEKDIVIKAINNFLFPNNVAIIHDVTPNAYPLLKKFSAFRECKIGNDKELENSVIWKAFQSLNSASKGYEETYIKNIKEELLNSIEYIKVFDDDLVSTLETIFFDNMLRIISIHKLLVVDCKLWELSDNSLKELKYLRLLQRNSMGHTDDWVDIIHLDFLDEYVKNLTDYYLSTLKQKNMNRFL